MRWQCSDYLATNRFVGTLEQLILFLGRLHVLLLHLPIGLLLLAVVLEFIARRERFRHLQASVSFVWALGAVSAIATVALGYLHSTEGGFSAGALSSHRLAGTSLALLASAIWMARSKLAALYARLWPLTSVAILLLLVVTGHYGGNLTHGDTYLAQYAPAPLQFLLGPADAALARARPNDLASADIYLDVVAPSLQQRCGTCHNDSKRKGELSVASYDALLAGGKGGAVIVSGHPESSDLIRRVSLESPDEDFMPRDGKTPLSASQVDAISWWVSIGAPRSGTIAALQSPPESTRLALLSILGLSANESPSADVRSDAMMPDVPAADPDAIAVLERSGFAVRPIAAGSHLVQVDFTARRAIRDADLQALARIGPQIQSLNLRDAGLEDAQLDVVGRFSRLVHLRLELNPLTDAAVPALLSLEQLEYLNLYGTRIGNAGAARLAGLPQLHSLYIWQTAVTAAAIADIERQHAGLSVNDGFDPSRFPQGPKVLPVVN